MSEDQLKQAMDTIAAQSETIAEITQAFTDLTRMTLNLAMGVRAATPRPEMLEFLIGLMEGLTDPAITVPKEEGLALCKEALVWLNLFKREDDAA